MYDIDDFLMSGKGAPKRKANLQREALWTSEYTRILMELAANRFRWTGLPPEVDVRFMELTILRHGLSVFYYEQKYQKFVALQGSPSGMRNMADEPVTYTIPRREITGVGGMKRKNEVVPIWANYLRLSDMNLIALFAQKLAQIERTLEINIQQARRTRLIVGNKNQRHSLAAVNNAIDSGEPFVGINNSLDIANQITAVDMGVNPDQIEKLYIARGRIWNQCMGLLGINHANQDKKERLVADEVGANDEQVTAMKAVSLNARQRAAAEINNMFDGSRAHARFTGYAGPPLNVSVDFNTDPDPAAMVMGSLADSFNEEPEEESEDDNA